MGEWAQRPNSYLSSPAALGKSTPVFNEVSMVQFDWSPFLREYNTELLTSEHIAECLRVDNRADLGAAVAAGWLGYSGAGEEELALAEERLDVALPPSYRTFLQTSNGWRWPGAFVPRLWSAEEVQWLRVTDPETIEAWSEGDTELGEQLRDAVRISDEEIGGTAVFLLLPNRPTEYGECEAWLLAHWIPGEAPYRSFRELMEGQRQSFLELEAQNAKRVLPGEETEQLLAKLPNLVAELEGKAEWYRENARRQPDGSRFVGVSTAQALQDVAERVRGLQARSLDPEALLASLRTLQQEAKQESLATNDRWVRRRKPVDWLRIVGTAKAMSRAEGLRQAAGVIDWFINDVGK